MLRGLDECFRGQQVQNAEEEDRVDFHRPGSSGQKSWDGCNQ